MSDFIPVSKKNNDLWYQRPNLPPTVGTKENPLWLLTPEELDIVPSGTLLHCIDTSTAVVGVDHIDNDTRVGYIAYGILESELNNNEGK